MSLITVTSVNENTVRVYARVSEGVEGRVSYYSDQDYGQGSGTDPRAQFFVRASSRFTTDATFTETFMKPGTYLAVLGEQGLGQVDYSFFGIDEISKEKYKVVFQFSGNLSTTLSGAASEILRIMSDIISNMTGGYVGTPYYEGSDKMVFMVGTMGVGGIEGFIASSPKLISLAKWFAALFGLTLTASYVTEIVTSTLKTINIAQTDAIIDKCLSSTLSEDAKAECVKRALKLTDKGTDWGGIVLILGGIAVAAYLLKDFRGKR